MHSLGLAVVAIFALEGTVGARSLRPNKAPLQVARQSEEACTLTASGGDDGPAFITAAQTCDTVVIPVNTTLSIASPMNMTDVLNTHIVRFLIICGFWYGLNTPEEPGRYY